VLQSEFPGRAVKGCLPGHDRHSLHWWLQIRRLLLLFVAVLVVAYRCVAAVLGGVCRAAFFRWYLSRCRLLSEVFAGTCVAAFFWGLFFRVSTIACYQVNSLHPLTKCGGVGSGTLGLATVHWGGPGLPPLP